jgi:hypothetical protein
MNLGAERPCRRATEELIPREARGLRICGWRLLETLGPDRPIGPDFDLTHFAEQPGVDPFLHEADALVRVTLVSHLRANAVQAGEPEQFARFADRLGKRFLDIHVLAHHDRHVGRQEMHMVRRRDADGVDLVVHLDQHLSKIRVAFGVGKFRHQLLHVGNRRLLGLAVLALAILRLRVRIPRGLRSLPIDIAQGDHLLLLVRHDIAEALAAAADLSDAHLGARGNRARLARVLREAGATGKPQHGRGRG